MEKLGQFKRGGSPSFLSSPSPLKERGSGGEVAKTLAKLDFQASFLYAISQTRFKSFLVVRAGWNHPFPSRTRK